MKTPLERLLAKVIISESGCWEWTASLHSAGYGQLSYKGRPRLAHRVSYELLVGEIAEGLDIDHLCRNRKCVNPKHLEVVTRQVNLLRGDRGKYGKATHCKHGHEFSAENTRVSKATGQRICRECARIRGREETRKAGRGGAGWQKHLTHCKHGHEFTPENTGHPKNGGRRCLRCQKLRNDSRYKDDANSPYVAGKSVRLQGSG